MNEFERGFTEELEKIAKLPSYLRQMSKEISKWPKHEATRELGAVLRRSQTTPSHHWKYWFGRYGEKLPDTRRLAEKDYMLSRIGAKVHGEALKDYPVLKKEYQVPGMHARNKFRGGEEVLRTGENLRDLARSVLKERFNR